MPKIMVIFFTRVFRTLYIRIGTYICSSEIHTDISTIYNFCTFILILQSGAYISLTLVCVSALHFKFLKLPAAAAAQPLVTIYTPNIYIRTKARWSNLKCGV